MELALNKLKEIGLKCNIEKKIFAKTKMGYLGFWVTRNGGIPLNLKMDQ